MHTHRCIHTHTHTHTHTHKWKAFCPCGRLCLSDCLACYAAIAGTSIPSTIKSYNCNEYMSGCWDLRLNVSHLKLAVVSWTRQLARKISCRVKNSTQQFRASTSSFVMFTFPTKRTMCTTLLVMLSTSASIEQQSLHKLFQTNCFLGRDNCSLLPLGDRWTLRRNRCKVAPGSTRNRLCAFGPKK